MDVIAEATKYVIHGKVPVLTVYQPLFAIAKKIPWSWPDVYGDSKYVVMMGGLQNETALQTSPYVVINSMNKLFLL